MRLDGHPHLPGAPTEEARSEGVAPGGYGNDSDGRYDAGAAENADPTPRSRARTAIVWGGAGFILGAVVWHFIGFWQFVTTVVVKKSEDDVVVTPSRPSRVLAALPREQPAVAATAELEPHACTALRLDRQTGETMPVPCVDTDGAAPRLSERSLRGDLEVSAASSGPAVADWTGRVSADTVTIPIVND